MESLNTTHDKNRCDESQLCKWLPGHTCETNSLFILYLSLCGVMFRVQNTKVWEWVTTNSYLHITHKYTDIHGEMSSSNTSADKYTQTKVHPTLMAVQVTHVYISLCGM